MGTGSFAGPGLFERLLTTLTRDPSDLRGVARFVDDLETDDDHGSGRLPDGFLPVWEAIWAAARVKETAMSIATLHRPDVEMELSRLKDFQRRTAEYVHRRLYLDEDRVRRFLVADEVGLGKTMVARGVIAQAIDHLWDDVDRIDVVYAARTPPLLVRTSTGFNFVLVWTKATSPPTVSPFSLKHSQSSRHGS